MKRHRPSLLTVMTFIMAGFSLTSCRAKTNEVPAAPLATASVHGQYEGYLPCADCPGIEYQLALSSHGTYSESLFYTDRSEQRVIKTGTYTIDGGTVVLDKDEAGMKYFKVHPQGLRLLDIYRAPITGELSRQYILTHSTQSHDSMLKTDTRMLVKRNWPRE